MNRWRLQVVEASAVLPYHLHPAAYIAVVLKGGYVEASEAGRIHVGPGDVVYHPAYQSHFDRVDVTGAEILNLPAGEYTCAKGWTGSIPDIGRILRAASKCPREAVLEISRTRVVRERLRDNWTDVLAEDLLDPAAFRLREWAQAAGLSAEALSRGFRRMFGTTPSRFRMDARAQAALTAFVMSDRPLANIAADEGFSDQPHMTRAVRDLTAHTPGAWRRWKMAC